MNEFTIQKFNRRTLELIDRPDLAYNPRIKKVEAAGNVCGIKQIYSLFENEL
jgi:hypothetical protein